MDEDIVDLIQVAVPYLALTDLWENEDLDEELVQIGGLFLALNNFQENDDQDAELEVFILPWST